MLHTQFARSMATKVVVATTWLLVGIDRDYIVLLSNPIEEGTIQCIVEKLDLVTGNTAGQDGDTLVMR